MEFVIWMETRLDGRTLSAGEVARIERPASGIGPEELGLTLQDGKTVLKQVQERIVRTQVEVISVAWQACRHCQRDHRIKDLRSRRVRTVFGADNVFCRRYIRCTCRGGRPWVVWPLRFTALKCSTPELRYLFAKWGSKLPYRRAVELFKEFLPLADDVLSHTTVRRHALAVGERPDQRVTEPAEYDWPESTRQPAAPSRRLTVAIDGTYIRATSSSFGRQLYVVAGRIDRDGRLGSRFAWIALHPDRPVEFMKVALETDGWTTQSQVAVLADGVDGLKGIVQAAVPQTPRSILD